VVRGPGVPAASPARHKGELYKFDSGLERQTSSYGLLHSFIQFASSFIQLVRA